MARIAVVDDSRLARTHTAAVLRKAGHEALEIEPTSLTEVLDALRQEKPDALITDFLMPLCPCTSLVRTCHQDEVLKEMRMIVLTAHHDEDIEERLQRVGVSAILYKPVVAEELSSTLEGLLT